MYKIFALILAVLVAACSAAPAPVFTSAPTPPPVETTVTPTLSEPAETVPTLLPVDLGRIEGATPADVQNYLGAPSLVRRDGPVQAMIFETSSCVFEVIFYEPSNGDHFRAEHIDARSRSGNPADVEACVRTLLSTP